MDLHYQERVLCYIDILGFKHLVGNNENCEDKFSMVYNALDIIFQEKKENDRLNNIDGGELDFRVSTFSDCIAFSEPFENEGSFFYILTMAYYVQASLLDAGVPCRGAISIGKLFHNGELIFGPALNEAVTSEEHNAIYPRIIVSKDTYNKGIKENHSMNSDEEDLQWINSRLSDDVDGFKYVNYFNQSSEFDDSDQYYCFLSNCKKIIENNLNLTSFKEHEYQKYYWMKEKFNSVVKHFKKYPELLIK